MRALIMLGLILAPAVGAQQFQQVGTGLPGPVVWSEGVEAFDADGDGRVDLMFANGIGFASAGGALAPTLLRNVTPPGGPITFADETAARLPAGFILQAKALAPCDVDGDGDLDVAFASAFMNAPRLLLNDGTGHFTDVTATHLVGAAMNSFGVACGDLNNDGMPELLFADAGPSPFGSPGGRPYLFTNLGNGQFSPGGQLSVSTNKIGAQNVHLVDVDNDFDLDLIVDGKSPGQQLVFNNHPFAFAAAPAGTLPAGSANTYATDWADLDNDRDIDGVYISLSGFNEGTAQNNLVPGGTLSFTGATTTFGGHNGEDDNDFALLDADNDGRLDVIVGSLGWSQEKLYLNAGTFWPGSFAYQATGFTPLTDSTLDVAAADFDGDGRTDVATAQGESGVFTNRVYRNTGPADTRPPDIARIEPVPARVPLSLLTAGGGFRHRVFIQDGVVKRGRTFVRARYDVTADKDGAVQSFSVPLRQIGGQLQRGVIAPAPSPTGRVGMHVSFRVHAEDPAGNVAESAPLAFDVCGAETYGTPLPNSAGHLGHMFTSSGEPSLSANNWLVFVGPLLPFARAQFIMGDKQIPAGQPLGDGLLFVEGATRRVAWVEADPSGLAGILMDFTQPAFADIVPGDRRYIQVLYQDYGTGNLNASDAFEVLFCD